MADITHRIGIKAPITEVYKVISTIEGLAGWWTQETSGKAEVGGNITFKFRSAQGDVIGQMVMNVIAAEPNKKIHWRCVEGPTEWMGTEITFDLAQEGEYVILLFGHRKWREVVEFTAHCSMKWAVFMLSLRDLVLTGKGKPSPQDIKIDNWN
ncbi:SRPBCC domain-containing protein [Bdellovibrio bacteriovorus]|uniref:SRPBCC family protein n=1 Tax=Bdellovibrio TaxID=958 RepID=UPI0035A93722